MYNYYERGETMGYLNEIHRLVLTQFSSENNWVNDIANIIVHPLVSLILTCIIFFRLFISIVF